MSVEGVPAMGHLGAYARASMVAHMLGQLANIPTDTLFDMLFVILGGGMVLTANDVAEIEQIQRELQSRGEGE